MKQDILKLNNSHENFTNGHHTKRNVHNLETKHAATIWLLYNSENNLPTPIL